MAGVLLVGVVTVHSVLTAMVIMRVTMKVAMSVVTVLIIVVTVLMRKVANAVMSAVTTMWRGWRGGASDPPKRDLSASGGVDLAPSESHMTPFRPPFFWKKNTAASTQVNQSIPV